MLNWHEANNLLTRSYANSLSYRLALRHLPLAMYIQSQKTNVSELVRFRLRIATLILLFVGSCQVAASGQITTRPAKPARSLLTQMESQPLGSEGTHRNNPFSLIKNVVKATATSVAHIEAKKTQKSVASSSSSSRTAVIEEAGSGVVYRYKNRTFVITNYHVIEDAKLSNIKIEANGRYFYPTHVEHDPATDLSVLFTSRNDLPVCRVGDSSNIEIGEFVIAVGSPFGLSHSVSYGIISAKGRRDLELGPQGVRFQDFFQTDAAINPGNSGGPLMNIDGEVIGINTAIASNSGGNDGIGFSIPIQMVTRIVNDLIDHGEVKRGFLGVSLDSRYSPERGQAAGLDLNYGTRVSAITENSPAETAGFRVGDIILEYNQKRISNDSHLVTEVSLSKIGDKVKIKLFRDGKYLVLDATIENRTTYRTR